MVSDTRWEAGGGCYTWDPKLGSVWGRKMGPLYFRQNLGWGNMSLIVGQIKSFHPPNKKEMNMMVSINLYGDVRGVHSSEMFLELFVCLGVKSRSPP